jgi:3-hydroxyisobutyrate dehydrogenase
MAQRLLDQGIEVVAWDRNPEQVAALVEHGAKPGDEPAEVVRGADVVITMLSTAPIRCSKIGPRRRSGCR